MLEQAIIDASALKKVALESAEATLIEKYSHEIKEAVETLLEQDDDLPIDDFPGDDGDLEGGEPEADSEFAEQLPSSFPTGDDNLGDKVDSLKDALSTAEEALESVGEAADELASSSLDGDEDEEIEIDFDQLEAEMTGDGDSDEMSDRDEVADEMVELEESILSAIAEELNVDMSGQRSGWGNNGAPDAGLAHEADKDLAAAQDDAAQEVQEELDSLKKENRKLRVGVTKLQEVLSNLEGKLNEVNLSNAKLVYSNKTYISDSLNERQKNKIVDAISKATTVAEAKTIYEALQSTVGGISPKRTPNSLSETINRNSSTLLPRNKRREERSSSSPLRERMQRLAGIK